MPFLSINIEPDNLFLCSAVDQYLDYNYVLCILKIPGVINHSEISVYHNMCLAWRFFFNFFFPLSASDTLKYKRILYDWISRNTECNV